MISPLADCAAAARQQSGRQTGFTLIEMMVVLAVMGLMLGLVLTHGDMRSPALRRREAVGTVTQALRLARSQAIMIGQPVPVLFDAADRRFRVGLGDWQNLAPAVSMAVGIGATGAGGAMAIRFAPDGSSGGGEVALAGGGQRVEIAVDRLTGLVRVQDAP